MQGPEEAAPRLARLDKELIPLRQALPHPALRVGVPVAARSSFSGFASRIQTVPVIAISGFSTKKPSIYYGDSQRHIGTLRWRVFSRR
jgi:hypothetical protein